MASALPEARRAGSWGVGAPDHLTFDASSPASLAYVGNSLPHTLPDGSTTVFPSRSLGEVMPDLSVAMNASMVRWWIAANARKSVKSPEPIWMIPPVMSMAVNWAWPEASALRLASLAAPGLTSTSRPTSLKYPFSAATHAYASRPLYPTALT